MLSEEGQVPWYLQEPTENDEPNNGIPVTLDSRQFGFGRGRMIRPTSSINSSFTSEGLTTGFGRGRGRRVGNQSLDVSTYEGQVPWPTRSP